MLKRELESLRDKRELLKRERKRQQIPTIAVVGYTNSGNAYFFTMFGDGPVTFDYSFIR